jgi:lipopolysaccharide biosynthesis glycosyltransferase
MEFHEFALVFAADDRFAPPLAVAMHSALSTLEAHWKPAVYVLDNGLSELSRRRLSVIATHVTQREAIRFVKVPPARLAGIRLPKHLPAASLSRLLLPELVDPGIRRAVYLDADVLVRRDLSDLFRIELGDAVVAAAHDFEVRSFDPDSLELSQSETEYSRPYYNAGVLVVDVPRWREAGVTDRALERARTQFMPYADQDALNATVDRWTTLDDRWNVQTRSIALAKRRLVTDRGRYLRERELYRSGAIWHFVGLNGKPWEPRCQVPGTVQWAIAFVRCGWNPPLEAYRWLSAWLGRRFLAWPAIAAGRWKARVVTMGRTAASIRARGRAGRTP